MKTKLLFTALLLAVCSWSALGQNGLGLRVGMNMGTVLNTYQGNDHPNSSRLPSTGINIGIFGNVGGKVVSFSPGLTISTKGVTIVGTGDYKGTLSKIRLNYLELPLLLRITMGQNKLTGYIHVGPYGAFMFSASTKYKDEDGKNVDKIDLSDSDIGMQRFDVGAILGGGVQYQLGPGRLFVDLGFSFGFIGLSKEKPYPDYKSELNFVPTLALGYMLVFGEL